MPHTEKNFLDLLNMGIPPFVVFLFVVACLILRFTSKDFHLYNLRSLTIPPCVCPQCFFASGHKKAGAEDQVIFRHPGCLCETL